MIKETIFPNRVYLDGGNISLGDGVLTPTKIQNAPDDAVRKLYYIGEDIGISLQIPTGTSSWPITRISALHFPTDSRADYREQFSSGGFFLKSAGLFDEDKK